MFVCDEQDSNMRDLFGSRYLIQRGCTYDKVEYRTAILPGCPIDSDPVFTYPVALSCHCGACRTDSDECAHRAGGDRAKCTKPVRRLYPYPGQTSYMIPFWLFWFCSVYLVFSLKLLELLCLMIHKWFFLACDGYSDVCTARAVTYCSSRFYCAFVAQRVCAAAPLLSLQWGFILVHISDSIIILLYTHVCVCICVCNSQTYVYLKRDTLNAFQLKLKSLNSSLTKLCLT